MKKPFKYRQVLLWTMRITATQLIFAIWFIGTGFAHDSNAQSLLSQKITVVAAGSEVKKVLNQVEKQADVKFVFSSKLIKSARKVNVNATEKPLYEVLDQILTPLGLQYEVSGKIIILKRQDVLPTEIPVKSNAPKRNLTGKVVDEMNSPLPGVSIVVKGTQTGTTTDADGGFTLDVPDNAVLVLSFVGFVTKEVPVENQSTINITLQADVRALNELVVVGYGVVKKSDLTGSVASIKSAELNAYPATNLMQSLAGRATGVQISQNTGAPGSPISVRIRGTNSVQGGNEPLYVVDGFPYSGSPTLLNNADVESIEILKDASATAIYGSRGANGVVLITTKKGKSGRISVDLDSYVGFQKPRKKIEMMNAKEYAQFYNEQAANDGLAPHFTQDEINGFGEGTDWQDLALQTAAIQNHSVSVNGGNEKTRFSISGSNFNQGGIIIGSNYVRNSVRANLSTDFSKKFRFDINTILSRIDTDRKNSGGGNRGNTLISAMLSGYPTVPARLPEGGYSNLATVYSWGSNVITNPLNFIEQQTDHLRSNKVLANGALTYTPLEGLSIKISGGIENTDDRGDFYTTKKFVNSLGSAGINTTQTTSLLNENTVSYIKEIGKHNISAVAGFTYQDLTQTELNTTASGFVSDIQESFDVGAGATQGVPKSSYFKWSLLSYLARFNYSFNEKFLATVSFRADGSSRYTEGQKWGYFPSGSIAYRLSEEKFIQNIPFISDLKIRVGYGETGSTAIDPYYTLNQLASNKVVFGDALTTSYAPGVRLAGPLKWETTSQSDIGLDIGFFQNRFSLTFDYYIKNTRDLLNNVPLPSSLGYAYTIDNVGKVQNKGFEISANANVLTGAFKWNLSANASINKNKVLKLYGGNDVLGQAIDISVINDNVNVLREGESIGAFYGYIEKGYDETGKIVYEDFNGNGTRDIGDKRIIGNPNPKLIYGFNSTMNYKNFELNVFIQGTQGNDIFNLSSVNQTMDYGQALNMPREVFENHWTPTNTNAKYPLITGKVSQAQVSNRFVEDGSYLRFKNIQLSYNVPVKNIKWLTSAQIYVSGQNLITFTKYSWFDPEISSYGSSNSIRMGIDHYSYPTAKTTTIGLRVGF
ncbi:TonB-dependent receptor [Dyadobacter chenwenxiniae]|uniref:TonB-dependent receptor n=1 Tax=Dyadobacter chenwenxiniae TaxID=2906456 RepID=A0A9X1PH12_9BACT|nr:TonB-dependent receptor [Dyadobacter chenwenxiniae]MCF0061192.1 TonB-dependent receptor [Dyadobacter chenwenxiniae]UON81016.1 TonB-dependent receptor [Dyadobacter chenwenxiniae]